MDYNHRQFHRQANGKLCHLKGSKLHSAGNHWFCVSTIECPGNTINLYDSKNHRKNSQSIVVQIFSFINCQATSYIIHWQMIKCQKQSGCNDCGLLAIATATALCSGILPSSIIWDQNPPSKLFRQPVDDAIYRQAGTLGL